jgi:hypothetical protein
VTPTEKARLPALGSRVLHSWERFWFDEIPPHIYALLRIAFGAVALGSLLGVRDFSTYWALDGLVAIDSPGPDFRPFLLRHGVSLLAGRLIFFGSLASFVCMTVGLRSALTVPLSFVCSLLELSWNYLPLSGAYQTVQVALFCLIWADCGAVWSVDAWLERRRFWKSGEGPLPWAIAPLRLIRFQIGLLYLNAGLWKLLNAPWRDGSAVHYVLDNDAFRRLPFDMPVTLDWLMTLLTYGTLIFEIGFPVFYLFRPTRKTILLAGIALHLGLWAGIEVGPFPFVMFASYGAFLDPWWVERFSRRFGHQMPFSADQVPAPTSRV